VTLAEPTAPVSLRSAIETAPTDGPELPIVFTGTTGEYFRIWIVNLVLTVLTLGIYAAWAKVRKRRYFYANTLLDGKPFDYTGNPIAILKGNLLIGGALLAYFGSSAVFPPLGAVFILLFAAVFPWLYCQALRFNAYNTRHRNIRFHFSGTVGESYAINLGLAIALPFTLGFIWPFIQFRKKQYHLGNLSYGSAPFRFRGQSGRFYEFFFKAIGMVLLAVMAAGVLSAILFSVVPRSSGGFKVDAMFVPIMICYVGALVVLPLYYQTRALNYSVDHTAVEGLATLRASLRVREVLWIEITNLLAIFFSLGLAIPWASIRRARYRFSHLHVCVSGSLDQVAATMAENQSAIGDSAADVLDFDIAL
jgi:uncharacterized membrane protein YjgN (DUF898 family)